MKNLLELVSSNPLFSAFHTRAWQASLLLEKAGFFTPEDAEAIRTNHLSIAWDHRNSQYVDLLAPNSPRPLVVEANERYSRDIEALKQHIASQKTNQKLTDRLYNSLHTLPGIQRIENRLGRLDLNKVNLTVYGKKESLLRKSSSCLYMEENGRIIIATSPDYDGLFLRLTETFSQNTFPIDLDKDYLGWPMFCGVLELVCEENHRDAVFFADLLREYLESVKADAVSLAVDFIRGKPEKFFNTLDNAIGPLGTALLIYASFDGLPTYQTLSFEQVLSTISLMQSIK